MSVIVKWGIAVLTFEMRFLSGTNVTPHADARFAGGRSRTPS